MTGPGARLRTLAMRICSAATMERLIDPAIADLQHEYRDAIERGLVWQGRWIRLAGCMSVMKVLVAVASAELARQGTTDDNRSFRRALGFSLAAMMAIAALLVWPPLRIVHGTTGVPFGALVWYLVPQALSVAIPLGVLFGILLAVRNRAITPRVRCKLTTAAAACSVATLVIIGWITPASNQAFRTRAAGVRVARGMNELTLREIASGDPAPLRPIVPALSRRVTYEFHARLALAVAPLTLALFAIGVSAARRRMYSLLTVFIAAVLWATGYYTVMFDARAAIYQGEWLPPAVAAWAANAVIAVLTLLLFWRGRREGVHPSAPAQTGSDLPLG